MIVYVYESLSKQVNQYVNPTLQNRIGFNVSNLTTQGYLVLMPDIVYESGNVGRSAWDCVRSAVQKTIDLGIVDLERIGIMGHSFGGYETNFIITQTNLFKAAVSGSAVADNVGHYFTYNTEQNSIDSWRYENQQYRMGSSFFENPTAFFKNNPLYHAQNINTPLLTWAGKKDKNVQPTQTMTFYAALRRLQKKHIMLLYPNEGHVIENHTNQKDITLRIQGWFDYHLKNITNPMIDNMLDK